MFETRKYEFFCWECGTEWEKYRSVDPADLGCPSCDEYCQSLLMTEYSTDERTDSYMLHPASLFEGGLVWSEQLIAQSISYSANLAFQRNVGFIPRFLVREKPYAIIDPITGVKYAIELAPVK
jgi:hypothetical protein